MALIADILSWLLIMLGCAMSLLGALGVLRLPDVFSRMHAAGMVDTAGAALILTGLMLQAGFTIVTIKLALIIAFLFFTSPTTTHALAAAALDSGLEPAGERRGDASGGAPSKP